MSARIVSALLLAVVLASLAPPAHAISNDIVISQVFGGGGSPGAVWTNDYIELFNRGSFPVSLVGWSVQYLPAVSSSNWQVTQISGVLQPGQYYYVEEASSGTAGSTPPLVPDAIGTINMGAVSGKVAVVASTVAMTGSCPGASTVDFIGYGTPNCSEGTPAAGQNNLLANFRAEAGCVDTDDNASDFALGSPFPRGTSSPLHPCAATDVPSVAPPLLLLAVRTLHSGLSVAFSLPSARGARIDLLDVSGRVVAGREVGALGSGTHEILLPGPPAPGVYFLRLTQADHQSVRRTAIVY